MTNEINFLAELIRGSFGRGSKNVAVLKLKDLNLGEVAYKTALTLEDALGKTAPTKKRFGKPVSWKAFKPYTNLVCDIGQLVMVGVEDTELSEEERSMARFNVGHHILNAMGKEGIFKLYKKGSGKRAKYSLKVQEEWIDFMEGLLSIVDTKEVDIAIYTRPMKVEPLPFTNFYNREAGAMVRNINPEVREKFEGVDKVFEVINEHQSIPYRINKDLLDVYRQSLDDSLFTFDDKTFEMEVQKEGLERERDKVLEIAESVEDLDRFWEYMFYDYRGRLYPSTVYLSHAGSKLSKSLYLYADAKPLTMEGYFWLLVHCANTWGEDKSSLDDRYDFADANLDTWLTWAKDPVNNKGWQEADSPFEFLAAIMEVQKSHEFEGGPYSYPSGLAVAWDASCSGLQVLSALSRDENSGKLCNLTATDERGDYYLHIADHVWASLNPTKEEEAQYDEITTEMTILNKRVKSAYRAGNSKRIERAVEARNEFAKENAEAIASSAKVFWSRLYDQRRAICKRPCMTYFYSCQEMTMADAMMQDHGKEAVFAGINKDYCQYLSARIYAACKELMPGPTALMELFIELGLKDFKDKKDFTITSPLTGFPVMHYYRKDRVKQADVKFDGKRIRPVVAIGKNELIKVSKVKSATSPNVVHMLDSQVVAGVIMNAEYTVSSIHDSFSTHAADAGKLFEDTRTVFVDLFGERDILQEMLDEKEVSNNVAYGQLNVGGAYENEHCFS